MGLNGCKFILYPQIKLVHWHILASKSSLNSSSWSSVRAVVGLRYEKMDVRNPKLVVMVPTGKFDRTLAR